MKWIKKFDGPSASQFILLVEKRIPDWAARSTAGIAWADLPHQHSALSKSFMMKFTCQLSDLTT